MGGDFVIYCHRRLTFLANSFFSQWSSEAEVAAFGFQYILRHSAKKLITPGPVAAFLHGQM